MVIVWEIFSPCYVYFLPCNLPCCLQIYSLDHQNEVLNLKFTQSKTSNEIYKQKYFMAMKKCFHEVDLQGAVSLTFCKLSKIISLEYTMPEITFIVRISSWNFALAPKAWALGTHTKFQLEIIISSVSFAIHKFWENILENSKTLVKQPQAHWLYCLKHACGF